MNRRSVIAALTLGAAAGTASCAASGRRTGGPDALIPGGGPVPGFDEASGKFILPALPYDVAALEPHIDAQTMTIHHTRHHQGYVDGLNRAITELAHARDRADFALIKHWSREVSFHGGGHLNHTLFWLGMAPAGRGGGGQPEGALARAIDRDFGSFDRFKAHFAAAANAVEGGGWAWLTHEPASGQLLIVQMEKQQDMVPPGWKPILGIDVWEHAYYLKYQNRRAEYISAFFNIINWQRAGAIFSE
ncbi:MAG: superoxide dismutase [Phycisphaeraceae bacterium]|nr:superoxide dismutase [Phycisphaeraceae bacterium]MCW5755232.1 superoxide dismutase [Phycisphaeraceae bacterium]